MKAHSIIASALAAAALASPVTALSATLRVGPGMMYANPSAAAAVAADGDVVEITAGVYRDFATWRANNLTIRGVGGRAHLDAAGLTLSNGKGIWVIQGSNTTVEGIEFSGAAVPDDNGAGIRQEGAGLTVRNSFFHDNQNGILAGDNATSDIVIESSEFARNGDGSGQTHNMYINRVRTFTLRGCYTHASRVGHLIKSRALTNYILYNRITGEAGDGSYEVNLPNGGLAYVIGNLIHQGSGSQNGAVLTFAEEGASNPTQALYVVNNTFVNDRTSGSTTFVRVVGTPMVARVVNNLVVGPGTLVSGMATMASNVMTDAPGLLDRMGFDYRLAAGSPAINAGTDPGLAGAFALAPEAQYAHPAATAARAVVGSAIDVGAYEFGTAPSGSDAGPGMDASTGTDAGPGSDTGTAGGDTGAAGNDARVSGNDAATPGTDASRADGAVDGGTGTSRGGCGCTVPGGDEHSHTAHGALALGALFAAGSVRRRRGRR